jgi:tRNA (cytosine49-C5)-methyltransferase
MTKDADIKDIKRIPNSENIEIKQAFESRYRELLGNRYEEFINYSLSFSRRSIRVNTLKISINEIKERLKENWTLTQIPWCKEGFWIKGERRDIGNLKEHLLGYFYVQESASMIPPIVLEPKENETILDMCAAPGSKATQIGMYMKNSGVLIVNDYKGMRIKPLGINIQKAGLTNTIITLMEGQRFKEFEFDRILVDAPCSGTGTIRKSLKTLEMWNPNMIKRLSGTQKSLIETAFKNLKEKGTMVYSTCSLEPEENEEVVSTLLNKYDTAKVQEIDLDIKRSSPVLEFKGKEYNKEVKKALRIWPQDNNTEGFFVCKIKKI